MKKVYIKNGSWRRVKVTGIFPVLQEVTEGAVSTYVTVDSTGNDIVGLPEKRIRVNINEDTLIREVKDEVVTPSEGSSDSIDISLLENTRTDEEIIDEIRTRFKMLELMTDHCIKGNIKGLIVTGPPGVGKSFSVVEKLVNWDPDGKKYNIIKGTASPLGLYEILYNNKESNRVVVFDDCDSILNDETSLSLLKTALDSNKSRQICWNSESSSLRRMGLEKSFQFEGAVIFISNIKFDEITNGRSTKNSNHLSAVVSRCHYLDLSMNTNRYRLLRIKQIIADGMLDEYEFTSKQIDAIVEYVSKNVDNLRELSLRAVSKLADLVRMGSVWREIAKATLCKSESHDGIDVKVRAKKAKASA